MASCPYAFIDSVKVEESWNGLNIVSSYTGKITGIVDVYRVGINPFSKKLDTLYIRNFTIAAGTVKNFVSIATEDEESTIVLKTGDGKGNHVRTLVGEKAFDTTIPAAKTVRDGSRGDELRVQGCGR